MSSHTLHRAARARTRRTPSLVAVLAALGLLLGLTGLTALPAQAAGASYYVDRTVSCSDSGSGTASGPFCTIAKGVSKLTAGDTLYIGNGTYAETIKPATSGTASAPITITAWPGKHPQVGTGVANGASISSRSYITVSNLLVSGTTGPGITISGGDHISVIGNEVTKAGKPVKGSIAQGIRVSGSSNDLIQGNYTHNNSDHGILLTSGTTGTTVGYNTSTFNAEGYQRNANGIDVISPANTIIGNITHDNEDSGINFYPGGNNNLAILNVTYNNGDHGIDDLNVTGGRIIGNTVYHNCTTGINVEGTSGNYTVENNVAVDNAVYPAYNGISCNRRAGNIGIWDSAPSSTTVDHNLVWLTKSGTLYAWAGTRYTTLSAMQAASGQEKFGVQADPKFANAAAGNLAITAGSPAIDHGNSGVSGEQSTDILKNPRVDDPGTPNTYAQGPRLYDDLGAYEYQGSSPPSNQAPTAKLSVSPSTGSAPLAVAADASGSTDPQGQTLSYTFDFGDGTVTGPQAGATANHTYTTAGSYTVKVTVTDTSNLSANATQTVTVTTPSAQAPTAKLTVTPTSGTAPLAVAADASGSTDPQGQTLSYTFDFGDGTVTGPQAGATANHTYTTAGSYTVKVTVTDTSNLSANATQTVTVTTPSAQAPTAKLTVTPTSGTAPLAVAADASGSTDPQGQTLSYTFDFGDGTVTGPQAGATANHTYTTAGSYTVKVTVTDTSNLSANATQTVTASSSTSTPPKFVNTVANNYSTKSHTSAYITVWRAAGVQAGDMVVLTLQLSGTSSSGAVSATDDKGNTYRVASDVSDGNGNRLLLLSGVLSTSLAPNDMITATFPTAATYRFGGDEFSGVTRVDGSSTATGTGSTFSTGPAPVSTAANDLAYAAVSVPSGTGAPTWASGWTQVASHATGSAYLARAYQLPSTSTSTGAGTATGAWLAANATFMP